MNPTSEQKRIAFGYNRHENRIVINEGQAACVKLISTIICRAIVCLKSRLSLKD